MISFSQKTIYTTPTKLPDELLDSMIKYVESRDYETAKTHKENDTNGIRNSIRSSSVSWINWDEWIPGIMYNMVYAANKEYFKFGIGHFYSEIQSTIYTAEHKDHYNWHVDNSTQSIHGDQERKISISLLLSDPNDYEGGELEFKYFNEYEASVKPDRGSAIIFPSWLPHKVNPVTKGKRISLVGWVHGPFFK